MRKCIYSGGFVITALLLISIQDVDSSQLIETNEEIPEFLRSKETAYSDSLTALVNRYYQINIRIFQANSIPADIDELFQIFTSDFVYIHPKYGGTYTREDLYNGYMRNQKNGGYDGSTADIKVLKMIVGLNAVAVEKRFVRKGEDGPEEGESQMTLFEFKEGKISKIFEYW